MTQTVHLHADDGHLVEACVATVDGTARGGYVVVHEIEGLTPHFSDVCDRLAAAGYAATTRPPPVRLGTHCSDSHDECWAHETR